MRVMTAIVIILNVISIFMYANDIWEPTRASIILAEVVQILLWLALLLKKEGK